LQISQSGKVGFMSLLRFVRNDIYVCKKCKTTDNVSAVFSEKKDKGSRFGRIGSPLS
jgi:hypothetical protein